MMELNIGMFDLNGEKFSNEQSMCVIELITSRNIVFMHDKYHHLQRGLLRHHGKCYAFD